MKTWSDVIDIDGLARRAIALTGDPEAQVRMEMLVPWPCTLYIIVQWHVGDRQIMSLRTSFKERELTHMHDPRIEVRDKVLGCLSDALDEDAR